MAEQIKALTGVRAVAAIGVVISHSGVPASLPEHLDKIAKWGYIGVPMFFMLSGVVLAYNYPDLAGWEGRRTVRFYVARIARVMPLYWAVIAYCAAYYWILGRDQHGWALLQNIFAVQTWSGDLAVAQGHYNGPGWSIGVEMFFYLLFPFLIPAVARLARRHGPRGLIVLIGAMTLIVFALWAAFYLTGRADLPAADPGSAHRWLYRNPVCYLPLFVCGMAIAFLIPHTAHWTTRRHHAIQTFVFCYVFGLAAFRGTGPGWGTASFGLLFVIPFALALTSLAAGRGWMARLLSTTPMVRLGVASYALYITHRWLIHHMPTSEYIKTGQGLVPYAALFVTVALLLLIAEGAHQYIEEPARRFLVRVSRPWTSTRTEAATPERTAPVPDYSAR
ncbi:acyltransferase family protein [Actinoplanes xinjiangensis]|uniref:Peptidoglycan/LPS O-acetylase OafA/YrhL n=1 Tax=Actinoplanes xinjiangensis TaxID=512350 RepID=A0A316FU00_9ACTN|nr:acyltransferase [Actinoplanes xinjiangensis]PWK52049.1 peptidoglycan/LPS O-acetylase OafA/YrhL [Actinoplanes xinjiangensis]GIF37248.1 acyltransferase [Actinoplanes xinjiangensis]